MPLLTRPRCATRGFVLSLPFVLPPLSHWITKHAIRPSPQKKKKVLFHAWPQGYCRRLICLCVFSICGCDLHDRGIFQVRGKKNSKLLSTQCHVYNWKPHSCYTLWEKHSTSTMADYGRNGRGVGNGGKRQKERKSQGLQLGGLVVKNLPSNASDIVWSLVGELISHRLWGN